MTFYQVFVRFLLFTTLLLTACGSVQADNNSLSATMTSSPNSNISRTQADEITVAAAADLQFAFTEIAKNFEQETGYTITLVFGSTGQLAQQIENGAPYDLFAAANRSYVDDLSDKGFVSSDTVALYARGRIVLAVNRKAGLNISTLSDLASPEIDHIAIANPAHAPYGVAAQQALQAAGVWDQVQSKLVYGENVRQALQYVQTGDAAVGIVALSVANVPEINWTLIDADLHEPLDQALALVSTSQNPELARQFAIYINGLTGRPIMGKYGFVLPGEPILVNNNQPTPIGQP